MSAVTQRSVEEQKDGMGSTLLQTVSGQPSSEQLFRGAVLIAVYTDKKHQKTRAKNLVVTGMPVSASCDDKQVVHDLCENELPVTPEITSCRRLSRATDGKVCDHGLQQTVVTSTHSNKIIDKVFVSQPGVYNCMVVKSLLKTKHIAVILSPAIETERCMELGPRQKLPVFDLRAPFVNKMRYYIGMYDWDSLLNDCSDIDLCYTRFLETLHWLIDVCIPCKLLLVLVTQILSHHV